MTAPETSARRLAAILAADIAGYSALVGVDEEATVRDLKAHQAVVLPMVAEFNGRVIDTAGDGIMAEFSSVLNALKCALAIQRTMAARNADVPQPRRLQFRIGINLGDVIYDETRIYGTGINVAARLEGLAEPGGICVSDKVYVESAGKVDCVFEDLGEHVLKNIAPPVRVYRAPAKSSAPGNGDTGGTMQVLPNKPSIAILPFTNMSNDQEQEYFADGMTEDLITALSRIRWLFVIARNSSFTYKGKSVDIKQVAREFGVRYILEGSVRRAGTRLRITGQLIEGTTGTHIWADRYDRDLADVFVVQDEVVQSVVAAIEPNLEAREILRARAKPTASLDAYDLYLRARPLMTSLTEDGFRAATDLLLQAIKIDPNYSDAWAALALCQVTLTFGGWDLDLDRGYNDTLAAAQKAVATDPGNGHSLAYAARVLACGGGNIDQPVELAHRALHLHPNSAEVQTQCGWTFVVDGNSDKALECFATARRLNPVDPYWRQTFMGTAAGYIAAHRFEDSLQWSGRVLDVQPNNPVALRFHAIALSNLGRMAEASADIARVVAIQPNYRVSRNRWSFRTAAARDLFPGAMIRAGAPE